MGTITNRNGRYRAEVRRKTHRECKTFATKAQAKAWVTKIEAACDAGRIVVPLDAVTVGDVLRAYRKLRDGARPILDTSNEHYMLKALNRGLGDALLSQCTPERIVAFATMRREEGAGPYTINMDISKFATALRYGASALKITPPDIVGAARPLLSHLRLIGGGGRRERRPTEDELLSLLVELERHRGLVYAEATQFAALTAMRRGEICALRWVDLDVSTHIARVARKHPRLGKTLENVPILDQGWAVVMRQPRHEDDGRVFPIHPQTLSKYFNEACKRLSIPDLHFHDLRHEGTSSLFEEGYGIEQVALVTGHKDWRNLKRYTNLRPEDLTRPSLGSDPSVQRHPGNRQSVSRRRDKS